MRQNLKHLIALLGASFIALAANACPTCRSGDAPAYLSGGIGETELAALRDREKDYNVKITFADAQGAYMADIKVVIRNSGGDLIFAEKNLGPILLLRLPEGGYEIAAAGQTLSGSKALKIEAKQRDALLLVLQ